MIKPAALVYLVDDDASFRRSTERLIESAGFRVRPFSSARDFLRNKRSKGAACLVLDVQLPGLSGLDLQRELTKRGSRIPVIFITGHGDIPMSVRAMKAGAVEFLTKPFHERALIDAIAHALKQAAQRSSGRKTAVDAAVLEKSLFALHSAVDVDSFWTAAQRVFAESFPSRNLGLTLQHNPVRPTIAKWQHSIPDGAIDVEPLETFLSAHPRSQIVRDIDVFPDRGDLLKSAFYRDYMKPRKCKHAIGLCFWSGPRLACVITIMRSGRQGETRQPEIKLLRRLYAEFNIALRRIRSLEREHSARAAFETFLRRLPLPTMLLRWNLKLAYQNKAAREFCLAWRVGPAASRELKAEGPVPDEILDGCRRLKRRWEKASGVNAAQPAIAQESFHHLEWDHLRVTITIAHVNTVGLTHPDFLVRCEEMRAPGAAAHPSADTSLAHLARLTSREQEVTRFACEGRTNQEIANESGLSVQMVKKHLHAIFRKLEVPSRSRLMALMR
ncbi:MAG TPA: response regulator [Candidatus Udaeobacter sp.]